MPSAEIEEFGKLVVRHVRDMAIRDSDMRLRADAKGPIAERWQYSGADPEAVRTVIPDVVDTAVFFLLQAIDNGLLRLKFASDTGSEIDLGEKGLGELSGWYMGSGAWRAMFSEERFVDDFAVLTDSRSRGLGSDY
jgi:hypothetical protein